MKKPVTYTIDNEVITRLKELSKKTMAPQSRLVEAAILEYLDKHNTESHHG